MKHYDSLKSLIVFLCLTFLVSACADFDSGQSLAFKQVPIDDVVEDNSSNSNGDNSGQNDGDDSTIQKPVDEQPIVTMNLRDKVLAVSNISVTALDNALEFYDANKQIIRNKNVITIFDITKHSGQRRLYIINTDTGSVRTMHVAHGQNSDRNNNGFATEFSNVNGSLQSSLGFMLTAETYHSAKNGYSMRLDGLESRNSNVRRRLVVVHGANYVNESLSKMGRSYGCPAVTMQNITSLINETRNGSLFYIYHANHDG